MSSMSVYEAAISLRMKKKHSQISFFLKSSHMCAHVSDGIKLKYLIERHLNAMQLYEIASQT